MVKLAGANGDSSGGGGGPLTPFFLVHTALAQAFLSPSARTAVTNEPLVDRTRGCVVCNHVVLHHDVVEGRDFHVVAADKWASLRRDNVVDVEIRRFRRAAVAAASSTRGVKSEKAVKGEASKKQKTAKRPTRQATALDLDLHPAEVELFYWDDAQQRAVPCVYDCGHAMRLRDPLGTFSCDTTCEEAQKKVASCKALDARTRESLGERSKRSVDVLYWDFALHTWVLWRGLRDHKLQEDAGALCSPKTRASRLCVRKRLTTEEEADHVETVKAAQARMKARAKRADAAVEAGTKRKQKGKGKAATPVKTRPAAKAAELTTKPSRKQAVAETRTTRASTRASQSTAKHSHSATVSKKALGKRRRLVRYDDEDDEDEEDEENDDDEEDEDSDDSDSEEEEERANASAQHETAAAVAVTMTATAEAATTADATDSQETVDTQPDADRAGAVETLLADEKINAHVLLHALMKRLGAGGVAR